MTIDDIKQTLGVNFSHIIFDYEGKHCGVDPLAVNRFTAWCGDEEAEFKSVEELIEFPFFCGESLKNLCNKIEITE
jgi:hypothetical protein